jgi:hypothetical protein
MKRIFSVKQTANVVLKRRPKNMARQTRREQLASK